MIFALPGVSWYTPLQEEDKHTDPSDNEEKGGKLIIRSEVLRRVSEARESTKGSHSRLG